MHYPSILDCSEIKQGKTLLGVLNNGKNGRDARTACTVKVNYHSHNIAFNGGLSQIVGNFCS